VVIGILIALSINNYNEDRILRAKEQIYLRSLRSEFNVSQVKLENLIEVNRENYKAAQDLIALLDENPDPLSEEKLSQLGFRAFANEIAYSPNNAVLNEMISSGSLRDLTNDSLRIRLTSWSSFLESVKVQEQGLRLEREMIRNMLRRENASIRTIFDHAGVSTEAMGLKKSEDSFSNLEVFKSREFENNVLTYIITSISLEAEQYRPLLKEITAIRSLVESEVKP
jgi:hypothetical protein